MDHRIMMGMFIGGVVMMAPPVLLGIGIAIYVLRQRRAAAGRPPGPARGVAPVEEAAP